MAVLDDNGFSRPAYSDLLDAQVARAKELFGEDIETSELTALGKFIRLNCYDIATLYEVLEQVYYARFPSTATGISLDRLAVFAGTEREQATYAVHQVRVTAIDTGSSTSENTDISYTVEAGTLTVSTNTGVEFNLSENLELTATETDNNGIAYTGTGTFVCTQPGTIGNVAVGSIINISYSGGSNISNMAQSILHITIDSLGQEAEDDVTLRSRMLKTISGSGSGTIDSLYAAIWSVKDVQGVSIIENDTLTEDSAGRPAKSVECYVLDGDDEAIAKAIFSKLPVAIKSCSTADEDNKVSVEITDSAGHNHSVLFSRPTVEYIDMELTIYYDNTYDTAYAGNGYTAGFNQIRGNIIEYLAGLDNGDNVSYSRLISIIHKTTGVVECELGIRLARYTDDTYNAESIAIDETSVARATVDNILLSSRGEVAYVDNK